MSYQVLARKWRPRTFQEVVGQEHVVRALVNALDNDRLHHAFLFTGTRGVGKTTIARIFAKSLNCEQGVTSRPCGACAACREIDEGRFVDLLEVDAASRTGVDDTRELLENVPYAPARGRYKVYLIDEVHMFSKSSFNALLKTLEEPPPHVKFLLATTDPQKLPVTVLSRCLQFNLRRLPVSLIGEYLNSLLEKEGIEREAMALSLIARAGDGSMRDALSLLDQVIAFGAGQVGLADVSAMLGSIEQRHVLGLLEALAAGDAQGMLAGVAELDRSVPDYGAVLADLISLLQRIALAQAAPETVIDDSLADPDTLSRLAAALTPEDVQLYYQIALIGRRDLPLSPDPRGGFEMVLVRMLCFRPAAQQVLRRQPSRQPAAFSTNGTTRTNEVATPSVVSDSQQPAVFDSETMSSDWGAVVNHLALKGMAQQLALNCVLHERKGDTLQLLLAPAHAQMRTKNAEERLRVALESYYGEPLRLHFQIGASATATPADQEAKRLAEIRQTASETLNQDPNVQALSETFNARVKPDSVTPTD